MGQEHNHSHSSNKKTLTISLVIITAYMAVEVIGGLITNSLALSDAISLFIAIKAMNNEIASLSICPASANKARLFVIKPPITSTAI